MMHGFMFAETSCELEVLDLHRDRKRTKAAVIVKYWQKHIFTTWKLCRDVMWDLTQISSITGRTTTFSCLDFTRLKFSRSLLLRKAGSNFSFTSSSEKKIEKLIWISTRLINISQASGERAFVKSNVFYDGDTGDASVNPSKSSRPVGFIMWHCT